MKSFGITDKGKVRSENQDSYIIENCDKRKCVIAVICDGMGGAKAGDLASRLSSKEFVSRVYERLAAPRLLMGNTEKLFIESCIDRECKQKGDCHCKEVRSRNYYGERYTEPQNRYENCSAEKGNEKDCTNSGAKEANA